MKFFKKLWFFSYKAGIVCFIYGLMLVSAISLFSISQKGNIYYGSRCSSSLDENAINYLNQEEIIAYDYELQCNTLYLDLNVKDDLNDKQITSLLVRISSYYKEINFLVDTQVTIKNSNYLVLANINRNNEVSLSVSHL